MIITLRPLRGCRPQHMKCATNLWKTKLQLFDSLVPAVFTMTAQADQAGADALLPNIPTIPHISY